MGYQVVAGMGPWQVVHDPEILPLTRRAAWLHKAAQSVNFWEAHSMKRFLAGVAALVSVAVLAGAVDAANKYPRLTVTQVPWAYNLAAVAGTSDTLAISGCWGDTVVSCVDSSKVIDTRGWVMPPYNSSEAEDPTGAIARIWIVGTSSTLGVGDTLGVIVRPSPDGTNFPQIPVHIGTTCRVATHANVIMTHPGAAGMAAATKTVWTGTLKLTDVRLPTLTAGGSPYEEFDPAFAPFIQLIVMGDCGGVGANRSVAGAKLFIAYYANPED